MQRLAVAESEEQQFILSNLPPSPAQKRLALGIVIGLATALYLVVGPFGGQQLGASYSFVAIYTTAMFVTDLITAILLFAQFSILRSRAILVIASGYLFTALLIVPYVIAFPGALAPGGLAGGLQTTAHLYLIWHCGFPLFIIGYALLKDDESFGLTPQGKIGEEILFSVSMTAAAAGAVTIWCMNGGALLPDIMLDQSRFVPNWLRVVGAPIAFLCIVALVVLWRRRRSILDLFLLVVLCAYLIEIPPHYFPYPARFSTGWYAVRVTSLLSSSIVLVVLLYEITALYGALLAAVLRQRHEREARLMTGDAIAATVAHEVRQPLTAIVTSADAGLRFLDRALPNLDRAKEAFTRIASDGHRAGAIIENIRTNLRPDESNRTNVELNALIREALDLESSDLRKHRTTVQLELHAGLPDVRANQVQLRQVVLNLIVNAVDAMSSSDGPRVLSVKTALHDGNQVLVSVTDSGSGIRSMDGDRVFDPLFTTKSDGMGMGLSICRSIVEAHNGRLWFTPNTPHGVVFQFTLHSSNSAPAPA
ncbi:MASE4 domain-containing protein [Lysobacter sp. Root494]|uniref:MASE4 domain-containing protein n=1 Tax=Lysobacter sp. Root494 TaxID=1736549 RepID=UPI0006F52DCE|nr:MASE4 domain-containing protein [Lysobacter sp. Root494]KQY52272.1 histidine kinase [Lysobacter sp. Root494]